MISFASQVGNLFNRLGKLGLLIKQLKSYQTSQLTNLTDTTNGVVAQFNAESDLQALIGSAYIGQLSTPNAIGNLAQNVAQQTINRMVFRDQPQLAQTLQQLQLTTSIQEVIRQMKVAGATVLAMPVAATPTQFSSTVTNVGNGIIVASVKRPFDGLVLENSFAENLTIQCITDSYSRTATAGNEALQISGVGSEIDSFAFDWPLGSNCQTTLTAIDGNVNNGSGNLLTNSGFNSWTSNTLASFVVETGTSGVQIFREDNLVYDGLHALRLLGDGSNLTTLSQTFGSSSGTSGTLTPQSVYGINIFLRRDGIAAGAGNLIVELTNSTGNVILDCNNVPNTFSIDLTALTTNYSSFSGVFRTPVALPSSPKIRLRLSTAITNGRSIYLDKLSMGQMSQCYVSGPFVSVHAGSIPFAIGDRATVLVSNSRGAGGTLSTFQTLAGQLFSPTMISNEFLLPSSSTPTISDTLIG